MSICEKEAFVNFLIELSTLKPIDILVYEWIRGKMH